MDNLLDETVSKEDYAVKNNQFDNTIEDLENEILTIKDTTSSKFDFDTDTIKAIVEKFLSFDNITNEMINQLIDKIVVSEDNSINIVYTFQALNL